MLERAPSLVTFSLILITDMTPTVARRSYIQPASKHEARRESQPENVSTEQLAENDARDAIYRDAMDSGFFGSSFRSLDEVKYPGKFEYFRKAEEVVINPVLPAGTPKDFHVQYSQSKSPRN